MLDLVATGLKYGGEIITDLAKGKINEKEAMAKFRENMLSLDAKIVDNQTKLNLADAQSNDPIRTRWRPMTCIGAAVAFLAYPLTLTADAWGLIESIKGAPMSAAQATALHTSAAFVSPVLLGAMGLREWGKTKGNS